VDDVQADDPVGQALQDPLFKKYPELQVVATVAELQADAPVGHLVHLLAPDNKT
jgi:hypothetical protein